MNTSAEQPILSVTELSLSLKTCVEQVFANVRVRGEVLGLKRAASGHIYFSLKDADSVLSAICWRGKSAAITHLLQEGLEIIATGKISTYPGRSSYQMIVESAEPAGEGALLKLLKERREKLEKEGLFDASRKKKIPYLPRVIGVVTSPTGAVIRDIMHRLNDRFPTPVYLWPVLVQGEGAAEQITTAIQGFNKIPSEGLQTPAGIIARPDVLIVARGGGSLEDLWCFNEENVARAAAASEIPLISAVGHETDTTLIDYAADLRAPTPTGAAEMAVPVRTELVLQINKNGTQLSDGLYRTVQEKQTNLALLVKSLPNLIDLIHLFMQKLDDKTERLQNAIGFFYQTLGQKYTALARLLDSYSYTAVLKRGFALVFNEHNTLLTTAATAHETPPTKIQFQDGDYILSTSPNTPVEKKASFAADSLDNKLIQKRKKKNKQRVTAASSPLLSEEQLDLFHEK